VNLRDDKPKIIADQIIPLKEVPQKFTKAVHIRLSHATTEEAMLTRVHELLRAHKGSVPVIFCFIYPDGKLVFLEAHEHYSVTPSDELVRNLESILGEDTVYLKVDTEKIAAGGNGNRRERRFVATNS
jgi:DNA polymerase-3 subunit alpha